MISAEFLNLFISCMEVLYLISMMFLLEDMFTIFKGFEMASSPDMTLQTS